MKAFKEKSKLKQLVSTIFCRLKINFITWNSRSRYWTEEGRVDKERKLFFRDPMKAARSLPREENCPIRNEFKVSYPMRSRFTYRASILSNKKLSIC